jgi:hypothetical protein
MERILGGEPLDFPVSSLILSGLTALILPLDSAGPASGEERKGRQDAGPTECRRLAKGIAG